jgi:hypothetical protein
VLALGAMPSCPWMLFIFGEEEHRPALFIFHPGAPCLNYSWPSFLLSESAHTSSDVASSSHYPSSDLSCNLRSAIIIMRALDSCFKHPKLPRIWIVIFCPM